MEIVPNKFTPEIISKSNLLFSIPLYQRLFEWDKKQIQQLLKDFYNSYKLDANRNYYIGLLTVYVNPDNSLSLVDGQQRFTRAMRIGEDYTEKRLKKRILEEVDMKNKRPKAPFKPLDNVIDISANDKAKSSPGYKYWATKHNLSTMADTINQVRNEGFKTREQLEKAIHEKATDCLHGSHAAFWCLGRNDTRAWCIRSAHSRRDLQPSECRPPQHVFWCFDPCEIQRYGTNQRCGCWR